MISRRKIIESQRGVLGNVEGNLEFDEAEFPRAQLEQKPTKSAFANLAQPSDAQSETLNVVGKKKNMKQSGDNSGANYISSGSSSHLDSGFMSDRRIADQKNDKVSKLRQLEANSDRPLPAAKSNYQVSATSKKIVHDLHRIEREDELIYSEDENQFESNNCGLFNQIAQQQQQQMTNQARNEAIQKRSRPSRVAASSVKHQSRMQNQEELFEEELEDDQEELEEQLEDNEVNGHYQNGHFDPYSVYCEEDNEEEDVWYSEERLFEVSVCRQNASYFYSL